MFQTTSKKTKLNDLKIMLRDGKIILSLSKTWTSSEIPSFATRGTTISGPGLASVSRTPGMLPRNWDEFHQNTSGSHWILIPLWLLVSHPIPKRYSPVVSPFTKTQTPQRRTRPPATADDWDRTRAMAGADRRDAGSHHRVPWSKARPRRPGTLTSAWCFHSCPMLNPCVSLWTQHWEVTLKLGQWASWCRKLDILEMFGAKFLGDDLSTPHRSPLPQG